MNNKKYIDVTSLLKIHDKLQLKMNKKIRAGEAVDFIRLLEEISCRFRAAIWSSAGKFELCVTCISNVVDRTGLQNNLTSPENPDGQFRRLLLHFQSTGNKFEYPQSAYHPGKLIGLSSPKNMRSIVLPSMRTAQEIRQIRRIL